VSSPRIIKASHSDTTPQVPARLAALRFVLDCYAKKEAAPESRPDDAEESKNDRTATAIIPKPS
jgi:hypothetical protein